MSAANYSVLAVTEHPAGAFISMRAARDLLLQSRAGNGVKEHPWCIRRYGTQASDSTLRLIAFRAGRRTVARNALIPTGAAERKSEKSP